MKRYTFPDKNLLSNLRFNPFQLKCQETAICAGHTDVLYLIIEEFFRFLLASGSVKYTSNSFSAKFPSALFHMHHWV